MALFFLLVTLSWTEPAPGAGGWVRSAAPASADRPETAAAPPALQLLRVGERDAAISFHVPRLPGRPPRTHFQLRVAAQADITGAGGTAGAPRTPRAAADGSDYGKEELRKIAVKAGADCAATEGCQAAAYALHTR